MTPKELFIKFGNDQFKEHNEVPEETINDPELKFIFDAMEAYGKQEYNAALGDALMYGKVEHKDVQDGTVYFIDVESLEKLKKL